MISHRNIRPLLSSGRLSFLGKASSIRRRRNRKGGNFSYVKISNKAARVFSGVLSDKNVSGTDVAMKDLLGIIKFLMT